MRTKNQRQKPRERTTSYRKGKGLGRKERLNMDLYEVVQKLVGPTEPIGETQTDNIRFENLKALTNLTSKIITDLCRLKRTCENQKEYSIKRAGQYAAKFLTDEIGIKDEHL